jgi:hypothetical protein
VNWELIPGQAHVGSPVHLGQSPLEADVRKSTMKVFLSSTAQDLAPHRRVADDTIQRLSQESIYDGALRTDARRARGGM